MFENYFKSIFLSSFWSILPSFWFILPSLWVFASNETFFGNFQTPLILSNSNANYSPENSLLSAKILQFTWLYSPWAQRVHQLSLTPIDVAINYVYILGAIGSLIVQLSWIFLCWLTYQNWSEEEKEDSSMLCRRVVQ